MSPGRRRFGTLRKLSSGRWQVRYRTPDGRRHTAPVSFAAKADADRYLAKIEADQLTGTWIDPKTSRILFGEWAESHLSRMSHLKPKTKATYDSLLRCNVIPSLGSIPLGRLQPSVLRGWVAEMVAAGKSASRIRQSYNLVHTICEAAVHDRLLAVNPCRGIKLPKAAPARLEYLTAAEVGKLAAEMPKPFDLFVDLLAYGGLRFGEAAALRRKRCANPAFIEIAESLADVNGTILFGTPKSHQTRWVTLPPSIAAILAEHLSLLNSHPDTLLFTVPSGPSMRHSNFMRDVWRPAAKRAGLEWVTPHVLRHTAATLLIDAGASIKDVQKQLGHADAAVTLNIYSAVMEGRSTDLAARLEDIRQTVQAPKRTRWGTPGARKPEDQIEPIQPIEKKACSDDV